MRASLYFTMKINEWQGQGTSIAMTESLVESNYRFESAQVKEEKIAANTNSALSVWDSAKPELDDLGQFYTVQSDGYYRILASTAVIVDAFFLVM